MNEKIFNVIEYGGVADGETLCTTALQQAIDACHAAGGGTVSLWLPEPCNGEDKAILAELLARADKMRAYLLSKS